MSHRVALILGLTAVFAAPLAAQGPARLTGRVVDAVTLAPISNVEIRAAELLTSTTSDGAFSLGSVPPGRVELRLRRIGYAPLRRAAGPGWRTR